MAPGRRARGMWDGGNARSTRTAQASLLVLADCSTARGRAPAPLPLSRKSAPAASSTTRAPCRKRPRPPPCWRCPPPACSAASPRAQGARWGQGAARGVTRPRPLWHAVAGPATPLISTLAPPATRTLLSGHHCTQRQPFLRLVSTSCRLHPGAPSTRVPVSHPAGWEEAPGRSCLHGTRTKGGRRSSCLRGLAFKDDASPRRQVRLASAPHAPHLQM